MSNVSDGEGGSVTLISMHTSKWDVRMNCWMGIAVPALKGFVHNDACNVNLEMPLVT